MAINGGVQFGFKDGGQVIVQGIYIEFTALSIESNARTKIDIIPEPRREGNNSARLFTWTRVKESIAESKVISPPFWVKVSQKIWRTVMKGEH